MNSAYENLVTRRSVRSFDSSRPLPEDVLDAILTAGTYAPTGSNKQDCLILLVQDPEDRRLLSRLNHKYGRPGDSDAFFGAPALALVLSDPSDPNCRYNGALVMGNLMNAAHALGVGSCWINRARQTFEDPEGKALLEKWHIEGDWEGIGFCILGYADRPLPNAAPRKPDYIRKV